MLTLSWPVGSKESNVDEIMAVCAGLCISRETEKCTKWGMKIGESWRLVFGLKRMWK